MKNWLMSMSGTRNWLLAILAVGVAVAVFAYFSSAQAYQPLNTDRMNATDDLTKGSNLTISSKTDQSTSQPSDTNTSINVQATNGGTSSKSTNSAQSGSVSVTVNGQQVQVNSGQDGRPHTTEANINGTDVNISVQSSGSASNSSSLNVMLNSQTETEVSQ